MEMKDSTSTTQLKHRTLKTFLWNDRWRYMTYKAEGNKKKKDANCDGQEGQENGKV